MNAQKGVEYVQNSALPLLTEAPVIWHSWLRVCLLFSLMHGVVWHVTQLSVAGVCGHNRLGFHISSGQASWL